MFKVLVLQKFHGLSDEATEEQIFDRTSFKNFLGLRLGDDILDAKRSGASSSVWRPKDAKALAAFSKPSGPSLKTKA